KPLGELVQLAANLVEVGNRVRPIRALFRDILRDARLEPCQDVVGNLGDTFLTAKQLHQLFLANHILARPSKMALNRSSPSVWNSRMRSSIVLMASRS